MIELITKNIIIGGIIILINLLPLIFQKYKLLPITAAVSLLLALLGIFIN